MRFLELNGIEKTYKGARSPCLKDFDFSIEEGEIVVVLGPSGCGKTTTLKIVAGLETQNTGSVYIDGECMDSIKTEKRPIAMVFQKPLLFRNMTVEQNVNFAPRVRSQTRSTELAERTSELLKLVKLEGYEKRKATELSGGQEQRVSLARALMTDPKLLLLDEPLSALDAELRVEMRKNIREVCKSLGLTVLFVTHDQQEAVAIGDKIALMMDGRIVQYGIPDVFYTQPASKKVAAFFGWKNFVPATGNNGIVESALGRFEIPCNDGDVLLTIRPEAATCSETGEYEGLVKKVSYLGVRSEYIVECNDVEISISVNTRSIYAENETIKFDLNKELMWVVDVENEPEAEETETTVVKKDVLSRFRRKNMSNAESEN